LTQLSLRAASDGPAQRATWKQGRRRSPARSGTASLHIAGAAIRYSDIGVRALPLPASHDEIRALVAQLHGSRGGKHKGEIGYITNHGGFVKSKEALVIARQAGQLGPARIRSDELCLEYLRRDRRQAPGEAGRQLEARAQSVDSGRFASWGRSRRPAGGLVSRKDLRKQFFRTALWAMGLLLLVGLLSNAAVHWAAGFSGAEALPGTAAQAGLYLLLGLAVSQVIEARGARFRGAAVTAFAILVALASLWPLALRPGAEFAPFLLIGTTFVAAVVTFVLFARIRLGGALLLAPMMTWIAIAGYAAYSGTTLAGSSLAMLH
jgi:tryptophan-rich sensory protein